MTYRRPATALAGILALGPACGGDDGAGNEGILPTSNEDESGDGSTTDPTGEDSPDLEGNGVFGTSTVVFACGPGFKELDVLSYDFAMDTYEVICVSSDPSGTELRLSFSSPTAGMVNFELSDHGVSLGEPMAAEPLDSTSPNLVNNQITFGLIQSGSLVEGSFEAEWDATEGGQIGSVSGSFSLDFDE